MAASIVDIHPVARYRLRMANNVLFLIHGVGQHGDDWADAPDGPIAALETAANGVEALGKIQAEPPDVRCRVDPRSAGTDRL